MKAGRKPTKPAVGFYSVSQAVALCGVNGRTLRSWLEKGIITPAQPSGGRGAAALLSYQNLFEVAAAVKLTSLSTRAPVRSMLDFLSRAGWNGPTDEYWIGVRGDRVECRYRSPSLKEMDGAVWLDIHQLKAEIKRAVNAGEG